MPPASRTARTVRDGPRTLSPARPISSPMSAERPDPPAAAAPTCQAMTCWARPRPIRSGVSAISAGNTPASATPSTEKAASVAGVPGCHQITAVATTAPPLPHQTTVDGGSGRGSSASTIRAPVRAPQKPNVAIPAAEADRPRCPRQKLASHWPAPTSTPV